MRSHGDQCLAVHRLLLNPREIDGQGFHVARSVSMYFIVQSLVQRVQAYPWFHMNVDSFEPCCINNGSAQFILPIDVHYLVDHHFRLGDLVQPLLHWECDGGGLIIVSCPRVSVALDHPVEVECPYWWCFSKFCLHNCKSMCMGRLLGRLCTSVYIAEYLLIGWHTNLLLLPGIDHSTVIVMVIQACLLKGLVTVASSR